MYTEPNRTEPMNVRGRTKTEPKQIEPNRFLAEKANERKAKAKRKNREGKMIIRTCYCLKNNNFNKDRGLV